MTVDRDGTEPLVVVGDDASKRSWSKLAERIDVRFVHLIDLLSSATISGGGAGPVDVQGWDDLVGTPALLWYSPGSFDQLADRLVDADTDLRFRARQLAVLIDFIEVWLMKTFDLIDDPRAQRSMTNRLLQMEVLTSVAPTCVPRWEVTTAASAMRDGCVLKRLSEGRGVSAGMAMFTTRIDDTVRRTLASERCLPLLQQEEIAAMTEYRTCVFGDALVTVEIPAGSDGAHHIDLNETPERRSAARLVDPCDHALPWFEIARGMGLTTFCVDYGVDADGRVSIFEVNPLFDWAWMPDDALDDLARAIRQLVRARTLHSSTAR